MPVVLVAGVVFINGWTDAPNAITGVVVTKTLSFRAAVSLAAVCNLLGLFISSFFNAAVANTMLSLINLGGITAGLATKALCAAMVTILVFAVVAWRFGIPTSESHALVAALAGASAACGEGFSFAGWPQVMVGLVFSLLLGGGLGRVLIILLGKRLRCFLPEQLGGVQVASAGAMAFMHGAQDGLKFMAVFVVAKSIGYGTAPPTAILPQQHLPEVFLCALAMMLGTATGGRRIISHIGEVMVKLDKASAICADLGSAASLFAGSVLGLPMSTTHTKTAAIMGAGKSINMRAVKSILFAWGATFPICASLGYFFTKFFVIIFA